MTNLFTSVNHNSQDVEEGQLPPDKHPQAVISPHPKGHPQGHSLGFFNQNLTIQPPVNHHNGHSHPEQESSSGQIVLEVVDDQFYSKRKTKKVEKPPEKSRNHPTHRDRDRARERLHHEKGERDRKVDKVEKKGNLAPEREQVSAAENRIKNTANQTPYYPPYLYPPPPAQVQMGQYPPMYHPYSYNVPPYQHYPPHSQNVSPQTGNYQQYPQRNAPPQQQFSQYQAERHSESSYKIPPPPPPPHPMYNYPGYPMGYPPYDYYERQRQAQQRQEQQRASRKREYMQQLRNELRRNVKDFNNDESLQILEAVKCILKFQDHRPSNSQSPSSNITECPPHHHEIICDSISQRSYERSLQRVQKWLQGDNPNIRQFMKGLLQAMQMSDVILKIKQLKLTRKMQQESMQSQTKRLLDVLVRDPKKMIF